MPSSLRAAHVSASWNLRELGSRVDGVEWRRRVDGVEAPRHRADAVAGAPSMAWKLRRSLAQQRLVQPVRQRMLVVGVAARHNSKARPDLVERGLDKHAVVVVDSFSELFSGHGSIFEQIRNMGRHPPMFIVLLS